MTTIGREIMAPLEQITIKLTRGFSGMDQASADAFYQATLSAIPLLRDRITTPFETLLKKETGFDKEHPPAETTITERTYGPLQFTIESQPREGRPSYASIFEGLQEYLALLQDEHDKKIKRRGVCTFDNTPHLEINDLIEKAQELRNDVSESDLKQTIAYEGKVGEVDAVIIPLTQKISLNESDAVRYVQTKQLEKAIKERTIEPFTKALREQTSYKKGETPIETIEHWVQVGTHLINVQLIPEKTVQYAKIFEAVMREGTSRTPPGEFLRIQERAGDIALLYDVQDRARQRYVSIPGTAQRLNQLKDAYTNISDNVRLHHFPLGGI